MPWIKVGELPFYGGMFPYFDSIDGAMVIAGGNQGVEVSPALSAAVWRSVDGVDWARIDNDLNDPHELGAGHTFEGKAYVKGLGSSKVQRGKLTAQWDVTATTSIKGTQIRWGTAGGAGNQFSTLNTIQIGLSFGSTTRSGIALRGTDHGSVNTLWYKKDITKGGGPWQSFVNGDPIPTGLLRNYRPIFTHGESVILPPSFSEVGMSGPSPHWDFTLGSNQTIYALLGPSIYQRSIWQTINGFQWLKLVDAAFLPQGVSGRLHMSFCTGGGSMWLIGGVDTQTGRQVYQSSNGSTWVLNPNSFPIEQLLGMRSCFHNGALFTVGGKLTGGGTTFINEVYKLQL